MEYILFVVLIILILEFRPVKKIYKKGVITQLEEKIPENIYKYNVIVHVHTQFSFDSLGKPSDIKKAMEENSIDYVFITDHDNDNYKYFEDNRVFAGVEKNTQDGRLLLLGNQLPVISHPNNFEFEHYRWKGEFKKDYLYEIVNIKDGVVWNKFLSGVYLLKNILIYPLTRELLHKWNVLIPLENWVYLYYSRARGLKLIGGLDLHVKLVYQEHTHGILIPSYKEGFKWLINVCYSRKKPKTKQDVINTLKEGKLFLSMKQTQADFWAKNGDETFIFWDKVPIGSFLNCSIKKDRTIVFLKRENIPVAVTEEKNFSYKTEKSGLYHFEVYEYDFKFKDFYFGVRPLIITNMFEVVDG